MSRRKLRVYDNQKPPQHNPLVYLTDQEKIFIEEFLRTGNITHSAKVAQYRESQGYGSLFAREKIQNAIQARIDMMPNKGKILTAEEVLQGLSELALQQDDLKVSLGAYTALAKRYGLLITRVESTGDLKQLLSQVVVEEKEEVPHR